MTALKNKLTQPDSRGNLATALLALGRVTDHNDTLAQTHARANLATALLAESMAQIDRGEISLSRALEKIDQLDRALACSIAELQEARGAYDAIITSSSWRIIAPLRVIMKPLAKYLKSR